MSSTTPPTHGIKDYLLPFLIIIAIGIVSALSFRLWGLLEKTNNEDSGNFTLSGKAELNEISGNVEVYLPAVQAWKIIDKSATLSAGESVRSDSDGVAILSFDDNSLVHLANSSEVQISNLSNSISKKNISLKLEKGNAGVEIGTMNADFEISSNLLIIRDADGAFILNTNEDKNTATAISGGFTAVVLDYQNSRNSELKNFIVEAGETIEISERRVNLIRIGGEIDLVKTTPVEISNSDLYLALSNEAPISEENFTNSTNTDSENNLELNSDSITTDAKRNILPTPLVITGNGNIISVAEPVQISGKVSPKITKIEVAFEQNDPFVLSKFVSGSGEWTYNTATKFGNLKIGINNYTVVGYDSDNNKSPVANFQINFDPQGIINNSDNSLENTDNVINNDANIDEQTNSLPNLDLTSDGVPSAGSLTFSAPVVNEPADGGTFTKSPIHFSGTVPTGTESVIVNEYKLNSFTSGDTIWHYNADIQYGNLKVGENEYEVVAVSEAGDRSMVTIKIIYTQEEE
jgi:hypothetical protein